MSLHQTFSTILNENTFEHAADRNEAIDDIRIKAGAALHQASLELDDIATKMSLRHVCDIDDNAENLSNLAEMLRDGGSKVAFFDATDAGEVPSDSLPGNLNTFFGPISAFDPEQEKLQISQTEAAIAALDDARSYVRAVIDMDTNDLDIASEILFAAAHRCRTIPAGMQPAQFARTA